jgi:oligoribonuclease (3'-5' exoribonuclease)
MGSDSAVYRFVGTDGEMTGAAKVLDFYSHYALIQIGVAITPDIIFTSDIGHETYNWEQEALDVNKFTHERIKAGPKPAVVDKALVEWVKAQVPGERVKLIPVGFNVASFDVPYVRYWLPEFRKLLGYRSVDLNSVLYTAAKVTGRGYDKIKDAAKKYAVRVLDRPEDFHNAGYDAAAALAAWEYLIKLLGGTWMLADLDR